MDITGLTRISECDNVELLAVLKSYSMYPLIFMWNISFITIGPDMTQNQINNANNFFLSYSNFDVLRPVSIPSSYFTKDCVLNFTLLAKYQNLVSAPAAISVTVYIVDDIPKIKFTSKSQYVQQYPGDQKNTLTIQIANVACVKNPVSSSSGSTLMPIKIDFQLFYGTDTIVMSQGRAEKKLSNMFTQEYTQDHMLSVDRRNGLKYGNYYKLLATITNTDTGSTNTDTIYFTFNKPDITAIIDGVGSIVSLSSDVILNGADSSIPESTGDFIQYRWSCVSCTSLIKNQLCNCSVIKLSYSYLPQLRIAKGNLQTFSKYVYQLALTTINNGVTRSSLGQIEFVTSTSVVRSMTSYSYAGNSLTVKDLYFSFNMNYSGSDSGLQYEWTLTSISSTTHTMNVSYTEKDSYITNFFNSLGIDMTNATKDDIPIPANQEPTYITPINKRILGVDQATLTPLLQYTFGVKVIYPDNPSITFISFIAPKTARPRLISVSPSAGVGFSTVFSILFLLPVITEVDQAQYQIFRMDCPSQNNKNMSLTQELGQSNIYTTTLAQGLASCNYQVEIIVRAFEFNDYIDQSCIVTVTPSSKSAADTVAKQLSLLTANNSSMTVDQAITTLSSVALVSLTEVSASTKNSVKAIVNLISQLDSAAGAIMQLTDNSMKPQLLKTLAGVMANMVTSMFGSVDVTTSSNISAKIQNYLNISNSISGGSMIIPTCLDTLSGVAQVGMRKQVESIFYDAIQQCLVCIADMEGIVIQPEAINFSYSTPAIEIAVNKKYLDSFNTPQSIANAGGTKMDLPGGITSQLTTEIQKQTKLNGNTLELATSLVSTNFNYMSNMKTNANINVSSLSNYSACNVTPNIVVDIYNDLSNGKLNSVVNTSKQDSSIIKSAIQPFQIQKTGTEEELGRPIGISVFPANTVANFSFTISNPSPVNNSIYVPLSYSPATKNWTNNGCVIQNISDPMNPAVASCDHFGIPSYKKASTYRDEMNIAIDIIKDVIKVIQAGNYKMLYNFNAFATAPLENYLVFVGVLLFFALIGYLSYKVHKLDRRDVHDEKIKALYENYGPKPEIEKGLLFRIYNIFIQMKTRGVKKAFETLQSPEKENAIQFRSPTRRRVNPCAKRIQPNGFSKLEENAAKEVKSLFHLYDEHKSLFTEDELYELLYIFINENVVLNRMTQINIEEAIIRTPPEYVYNFKESTPTRECPISARYKNSKGNQNYHMGLFGSRAVICSRFLF